MTGMTGGDDTARKHDDATSPAGAGRTQDPFGRVDDPYGDVTADEAAAAAETEATIAALATSWHGGAPTDAVPVEGTAADPAVDGAVGPGDDPDEPVLPAGSVASPSPLDAPTAHTYATPAASVYRSPDDRNRSVYRRANPWYRRMSRGAIALSILGGLAVAIYFGAREAQDYLDRDRLPSPGAETPDIRQSTFVVRSTVGEAPLQGTLTVDFDSGAYEFVGAPGSPNAADNITSPDGEQVFAQTGSDTWQPVDPAAPVITSIDRVIALVSNNDNADAILTNRLRRGYVDLIREIDEGEGDDLRTRYDLELQLAAFADDFPLQWQDFGRDAIPGIAEDSRHAVTIWVDPDDVLVGVDDPATGWAWERVDYSSSSFAAIQPTASQIVEAGAVGPATSLECRILELNLAWDTTLASCDEAIATGQQLAVQAGLADTPDDPTAELAFASVCTVLQGTEERSYDDPQFPILGGLLVDAGVCPGNTALLQPAG
jgi:hypothetical protein